MKGLLAAAVLFIAAAAYGGEIYDVIPDDAIVVAVADKYEDGVGALKRLLDACVPASMPGELGGARMPLLGELVDLRKTLDQAQEEAGAYESPLGIGILAGADGKARVVTFEPVSEADWKTANAPHLREGPGVQQLNRGAKTIYYQFNGAYLITSTEAEGIREYARCIERPLSAARRKGIAEALSERSVAVNISAPTVVRAWAGGRKGGSDIVASAISQYFDGYATGTNTIPMPASFISAVITDYATYGDEIYVAADIADDRVEFSARARVKEGSLYAAILSSHEGKAREALSLVPATAAAALAVSFAGDIFWEHARSMLGSYVGGALKEQAGVSLSLKIVQQVFDEYRLTVGLEKAALALVRTADGKYPAPVLVAETADSKAAVSSLAKGLVTLYSDNMLASYGKQEGFYLSAPVLEQKTADAATVKIPFSMSSLDPVNAARVKGILGGEIVWRLAAMQRGGGQAVVAGEFSQQGPMDAVTKAPAAGAGVFFSGGVAGKAVAAGFVNLPALAGERLKVALQVAGKDTGGVNYGTAKAPCTVTCYASGDGLTLEGKIPAEQIKSAFGVIGKAPVVIPPKEEAKPKPGEKKPLKKRGFGRQEGE
jgi:hypothetical protein